jgi:hypothetical protein
MDGVDGEVLAVLAVPVGGEAAAPLGEGEEEGAHGLAPPERRLALALLPLQFLHPPQQVGLLLLVVQRLVQPFDLWSVI